MSSNIVFLRSLYFFIIGFFFYKFIQLFDTLFVCRNQQIKLFLLFQEKLMIYWKIVLQLLYFFMLVKSFALQFLDLGILLCQLLIQAFYELSLLRGVIYSILRLRFMIYMNILLFIFFLFLFSKKFSDLLITLLDRVMELFLLEFRSLDLSFSILKVFRLLLYIFYIVID